MNDNANKRNDVVDNNEDFIDRFSYLYFSDFWRGFVKFWWVGVVLAIIFGGAIFYRSYTNYTPSYSATATFTVHTQNATLSGDGGVSAYSFYYDRGTADQLASVFPYILQSEILQKQVCQKLGVNKMPATVSATCVPETNMITLTTTGTDPQMTYDVLVCVTENYSSVSEYIVGQTKLVMISPPVVPTEPNNQFVWLSNTLTGVLIGLVLGLFWIILYGALRRTIRTKEDIKRELNQKCIGVVPQVFFKKYRSKVDLSILITNPLIGNSFLESLRLLRDSVHNSLDDNEKVVMITSTAPGEGKSIVSLNLAAMYAKNSKVLIIDGDLRNSGISKLLQNNEKEEKRSVKNKDGKEVFHISSVESLNLDLLSFNDSENRLQKLVRTSTFKKIIDVLRNEYDMIFIDTPPCGMISDAAIISNSADAALYVIRQDTVMDSSIREGLDYLLSTDINLLGCILNGTVGGIGGYGGDYGYGYGYGGYKKYYRYNKYYGKYGYGYGYENNRRRHKRKEVQK